MANHSNTFTTETEEDGDQVIHEELPVSLKADHVTEEIEIQDAEA